MVKGFEYLPQYLYLQSASKTVTPGSWTLDKWEKSGQRRGLDYKCILFQMLRKAFQFFERKINSLDFTNSACLQWQFYVVSINTGISLLT